MLTGRSPRLRWRQAWCGGFGGSTIADASSPRNSKSKDRINPKVVRARSLHFRSGRPLGGQTKQDLGRSELFSVLPTLDRACHATAMSHGRWPRFRVPAPASTMFLGLDAGHKTTRIHRSARRRVGRVDERDRPSFVHPGRGASFHCPSRGIPPMASRPVTPGEPIAPFVPDLEALIAEVMDEWKIPGLAIAVVQNGDAALVKAYGLRDVEAGLPVTTDTHFMICSITKSFTSTGLALFVDEQRLDWKKPVRDY